MIDFGAFGTTFGQCFNVDFSGVDILNFIAVLFAFLFVDIFDTLGTLIGVSTKANMLDEEGKLPRIRPALLADAIATSVGAIFGTSTTTTYVESSAGVAAGGRTGLSAMVTGLLFLLAIVFAPINCVVDENDIEICKNYGYSKWLFIYMNQGVFLAAARRMRGEIVDE